MMRTVAFAVLCAVASVCNATTFYVSTSGSDENDGLSLGTAFSSLARAVDAAGADEAEILIAPGTYTQSAAVRVEAPLSIRGTGAAATNVVLRNTEPWQHVITIAHEHAELALVQLTGGSATNGPACLGIEAGLVRDCWVTGCTYTVGRGLTGGTVVMSGGRLARSVIKGNSATSHSWEETFSAGVYATAGVVENCLIIRNSSKSRNQSNIETSALSLSKTAQAVNCTIIGNSAQRKDSVDTRVPMTTHVKGSAKIVNCVIFGNTCDNPNYTVWAGTAANYVNCASEVAINATCPAIIDPAFTNPDNGDYTPIYTSPLRDAGSNADYTAAATSSTDIKGDTRILHDVIDIGAWEFVPGTGLAVDFSYTVNRRLLPGSVTFTAVPENASGEVVYKWDFDSDGTADRETTDATITAEFADAKVYNVTLTAISGQETATAIKYQAFSTIQKDLYVATNGTAAYPFATPATASTTIHAAIAAADEGCVIHVLPGTYDQNIPFMLDKAVTFVSTTTNAVDVILRNTASNQRIVEVSHENAELAGITLTDGMGSSYGSALTLTAGLVRDCVITHNGIGGGKNVSSGTVWMSGGRLMRCCIAGNSNIGNTGWNADCAAGVNASGGVIDTCLVATNRVNYYGDRYTTAQGIKLTGSAKAINCTIANNVCANPSGANVYPMATSASANARFVNCLIWGNVTKDGDEQRHVWNGSAASYVNCYSELTINETSPAVENPGLVDVANGNYALAKNSPLVNKGVDYASVGGESEFDLSGVQNRIVGSRIDIGCYEGVASGISIRLR